ncbi:MAG TPA: hypothetical protein VEY51_21700, partial [Chondromyces sp.]|nr:hypothetical protein [Chondromyces sp.]
LGQSYLISEGQLEIHLKNRVTGNVFSSSDPSRCRITLLSDHVVNLDWEDSGDGSFGDYITRLIIA